jgi:hypothetical protein
MAAGGGNAAGAGMDSLSSRQRGFRGDDDGGSRSWTRIRLVAASFILVHFFSEGPLKRCTP